MSISLHIYFFKLASSWEEMYRIVKYDVVWTHPGNSLSFFSAQYIPINPFLHTIKLQHFKNSSKNIRKKPTNESVITEKLKKLWQICLLWAISFFPTMFSKVVCCRDVRKWEKVNLVVKSGSVWTYMALDKRHFIPIWHSIPMLWVLKRIFPVRRFFWVPTT